MTQDFNGKETHRGGCEALALQRVDPDIRDKEADLFSSKWFDLRLQHPVHATYFYAHCYREAARSYCRVNNDSERADSLKVFSDPDIFKTRELTACINARQALDRIGCRYEFALSWVQKRLSDRGWLSFPRPNQLYSEELLLDIRDAWSEECKVSLQIASDPHFRLTPGSPLQPVQCEYVDWLMGEVRFRGIDAWRPLSRLLAEQVITPEIVVAHFGAETLLRAVRLKR